MLDRAPRKTPRQRAAFKRRAEAVKRRITQRWGYRFRDRLRWRSRGRQMNLLGLKVFLLRELSR